MIFSDGVHMVSDESLEDLHRYAKSIGIGRWWFHKSDKFPHYDIPKKMRTTFFEKFPAVQKVSSKKIVLVLKALRKAPSKA